MLSKERSETLTATGQGTPGGALLRRYWQLIALAADMNERNPLALKNINTRSVCISSR